MIEAPGYLMFLESKENSAMFRDSEMRILKRYCSENDGVIRFMFVGDNQVAEMRFGPSEYDRMLLSRTPHEFVLYKASDDIEKQPKKLKFSSFKEAYNHILNET